MGEQLRELESVEDLTDALNESVKRPILLFKHSLTCSISLRAFDALQSYLEQADSRISYNLITVQTGRDISELAASTLRVTHESPQAILVRNGREVWNASHFDITKSALDEAIRRLD
jgi:bacillithiol system protein YtxJ